MHLWLIKVLTSNSSRMIGYLVYRLIHELLLTFQSSDMSIEDFVGSFCISRSDASENDRLYFFLKLGELSFCISRSDVSVNDLVSFPFSS